MVEHRKHWMRHTAMVPKGFIRFQVLESLSKKPMSGSEIINEVETRTNGRWKPSPGSVYPLLSWLQDNGHIRELPSNQSGMKRYELTDSGKAVLEQQRKIMEEQEKMIDEQRRNYMKFRKEGRFFGPPFMRAPWFHLPPEKTEELRESMRKLMRTSFKLGENLEKHFSEQVFEDVRRVLDETAEKLEKINERLGSRENE
ncbi:MAG: PadR family transcriptional regulator [Candidatus Bathyarchaeia archaeon]